MSQDWLFPDRNFQIGRVAQKTRDCLSNKACIDPFHKWLPIINSFVIIKISLTNLVFMLIILKNFYFLLLNEVSQADLNAYKRILNWQPFIKRVYGGLSYPLDDFQSSRYWTGTSLQLRLMPGVFSNTNDNLFSVISPRMSLHCKLQSWTKVLIHLSKTNAFYRRPSVVSKTSFCR